MKENEEEIVNFKEWTLGKIDENREMVMKLEEEGVERL